MDKNPAYRPSIGGGNMASALGAGMAGKICLPENFHVIDINTAAHAPCDGARGHGGHRAG